MRQVKVAIIGVGDEASNIIKGDLFKAYKDISFFIINFDFHCHKEMLSSHPSITLLEIPFEERAPLIKTHDELCSVLAGMDLVFLLSELKNSREKKLSSVVARITKGLNIFSIGIVNTPFAHEDSFLIRETYIAIKAIKRHLSGVITISNDRVQASCPRKNMHEIREEIYNRIYIIIDMIVGLLLKPGLIGCDFSNVCSIIQNGVAFAGRGCSSGGNGGFVAAQKALANAALENFDRIDCKSLLVSFTSGRDLTVEDFCAALDYIRNSIRYSQYEDLDIFIGLDFVDNVSEIIVTVIGSGQAMPGLLGQKKIMQRGALNLSSSALYATRTSNFKSLVCNSSQFE